MSPSESPLIYDLYMLLYDVVKAMILPNSNKNFLLAMLYHMKFYIDFSFKTSILRELRNKQAEISKKTEEERHNNEDSHHSKLLTTSTRIVNFSFNFTRKLLIGGVFWNISIYLMCVYKFELYLEMRTTQDNKVKIYRRNYSIKSSFSSFSLCMNRIFFFILQLHQSFEQPH